MNFSRFMAIAAALAFVFGLAFLLIPAQLMSLYGITLDPEGQWVGRYLGSAFIGIAVLTWLARNLVQGNGVRAIVIGDFVVSISGLAVAILDAFFGLGNALTWSTVAIYLFLTIGFGYFLFVRPVGP